MRLRWRSRATSSEFFSILTSESGACWRNSTSTASVVSLCASCVQQLMGLQPRPCLIPYLKAQASSPSRARCSRLRSRGQFGTMVQPRHPDLLELLTNRELEVLQLLALRLTNKEIAQALGISTGTVKQHTINLFRKLHVENRREAILQARAMGFQIETPYPL